MRFVRGLSLVSFAAGALAQSPPPAASPQNSAELSAHEETATFKSKVNLVSVPVVVRDSQGHAIGNLNKEDFQLFDKGKPQIITRFTVERRDRAATPVPVEGQPRTEEAPQPTVTVPQQYVAYLFDDVHLDFPDLARSRDAADRNILATLGPEARVAIYTTSGQGNLDFTDDRAAIHGALARLRPRPVSRLTGAQCPDVGFYMADLIANKSDPQALEAAIQDTIGCEHLENLPNPRAVAEPQVRSTAFRDVQDGEHETHLAFTVVKDVVRRISVMPGQRVVVLTSPGFLVLTDNRSEESEVLERAVHSNVIINALDARGLYADNPLGDISKPTYSPLAATVKAQYEREASRLSADVMAELAAGTGGLFYQNSNDLERGFRRLASAPEFLYVLGFSPQNLKLDGSFHRLKVTLRGGQKLEVQARRGYYAPTHALDPVDTAKEEIAEAVYSQEEVRELPVELHTQFFKATDTDAKLAVLAHFDLKHLPFQKANGRNNNELTIVTALFDRNGNYLQGIRKNLTLHLRDETLANRLDSGLTVKTSFDVKPGNYLVRLVVRDAEGQQMAAESGAVEIP